MDASFEISEILAECPFCKSKRVALYSGSVGYYVCCTHCGARGPFLTGSKNAVRHWNDPINLIDKQQGALVKEVTDLRRQLDMLRSLDDMETRVKKMMVLEAQNFHYQEVFSSLMNIIEYLHEEKDDYFVNGESDNHIYKSIDILKKLIEKYEKDKKNAHKNHKS